MSKFIKSEFNYHGGYLTYQGKFVARFKHVPSNRPGFVSFLCSNFTVEEYFAALANSTPVEVAEAKGYIKKWIKQGVLKEWKGVVYA